MRDVVAGVGAFAAFIAVCSVMAIMLLSLVGADASTVRVAATVFLTCVGVWALSIVATLHTVHDPVEK